MPSDPFATPAPSAPPAPGSPSGATYPGATASGANAPGTAYPGGPSYPGASYPGGNLPGTAYPGGPTYPGPGTPAGPPRKSKAPQIVGIVAGALVLLLVGGFFAVRGLVSSVVSDAKPSATAPVAAPTTKAVSTPVSYTHLDVYKRQDMGQLILHGPPGALGGEPEVVGRAPLPQVEHCSQGLLESVNESGQVAGDRRRERHTPI